MAAFSRYQLVAALLEYDNDDDDPDKPRRSAHDSAIFAHLRRNLPPRPARRSTDYLGVSLPSEGSASGGGVVHENAHDTRRSRGSIDALRNPFGRDSTIEGGLDDEELEVDLTSWGLDAFIPKETDKGFKNKGTKAKSDVLPNPHSHLRNSEVAEDIARQRPAKGRTVSLGNWDSFGEGGAFLDAKSQIKPAPSEERRYSIGTALDLAGRRPITPGHKPQASHHALVENLPLSPPLHAVPFPKSPSIRTPSPLPPDVRASSRASLLDQTHARTHSAAGIASHPPLNDDREEVNPFFVRAPSPERASRFDPKARTRTISDMTAEPNSNPFAIRPPSPGQTSRFDPKTRARTISTGTLATQMMLGDNDAASVVSRPRSRLYSRMELMRPKVLIMPSPLQSAIPQSLGPPGIAAGDGFVLTSDPPLPSAARPKRRDSMTLSMIDTSPSLVASNSFTPNPRSALTLSQLTFRNTLLVDGQADVAYTDIDARLPRATQEGMQIMPEPDAPEPTIAAPSEMGVDEPGVKRPPGKLFGKSLIDDLEARKAAMRGKQRVFRGDDRPSMMARAPLQRPTTLIDPATLVQRPVSQHMDSFGSTPGISRRASTLKPLLNFDDTAPRTGPNAAQGPARSVFGVDTLWERELAKLKELEKEEARAKEEQARREAEGGRKKKKGKSKKKKDQQPMDSPEMQSPSAAPESPPLNTSLSYVEPSVPRVVARRAPPPPVDDIETESESDTSDAGAPERKHSGSKSADAADWFAGSSDEEKGPRRTTGSGPRYPAKASVRLTQRRADDDSEEDMPLAATINRAVQRATQIDLNGESSDEEKPLSSLLDKTKARLPSLSGSFTKPNKVDSDEDDTPLGLRLSHVPPSLHAMSPVGQGDEDDTPLGLHPEQMRRSQYVMAQQQQQQQQQQQMMMRAQMAQSMIFGAPSMMASGFFASPMAPPMMIPPQIPSTPPPMHDAVKFGRVDQWRRDVAVEGTR